MSGEFARNMPASPRRMRAAKQTKQRLSLQDARANALKLDWSGRYRPPTPSFVGMRTIEQLLARGAARVHRLVAVLFDVGADRQIPRHTG